MAEEPAAPDTGGEDQPAGDEPAPASQEGTETPATGDSEPDYQAEAEKWKGLAQKHEKRAKDNAKAAKELEDFKTAQLSEQEKAVKEAEDRGRKAGSADSAERLAAAEIKAALTGVVADPGEIVEDLKLAKYVTEDGDVDLEAVGKLKAKYEAMLKPADGDKPSGGLPGKPTEDLRGGGDPTRKVEETDPRKLAESIRRV